MRKYLDKMSEDLIYVGEIVLVIVTIGVIIGFIYFVGYILYSLWPSWWMAGIAILVCWVVSVLVRVK